MTKILIVSDTHGDIDTLISVKEYEHPNYVIHAGDCCVDIELIKKHTNYFVAGNNDFYGEQFQLFKIEDINFYLTHGHQYYFSIDDSIYSDAKLFNCDVAITGHTHIENIKEINNILLINPGSLIKPRNILNEKTYCILEIDKNKILSCEIKKWFNKY